MRELPWCERARRRRRNVSGAGGRFARERCRCERPDRSHRTWAKSDAVVERPAFGRGHRRRGDVRGLAGGKERRWGDGEGSRGVKRTRHKNVAAPCRGDAPPLTREQL